MTDFATTKVTTSGIGSFVGICKSTVSGSTCTVERDGIVSTYQVLRGLSPQVNDAVSVQRHGSLWVVVGILYAAAVGTDESNQAAPTPNPVAVNGKLVVSPIETRTWDSDHSSWTYRGNDSVYQGEYSSFGLNRGCIFYGSKPSSLEGATATGAYVSYRRLSKGGSASAQTSTLWLVTNKTRPAGAPTLTSSTTGPTAAWGAQGTFTVPTSWAQAMLDGTAGGLALYDADGSPYMIFAGRSDWSAAWTLTINYTR